MEKIVSITKQGQVTIPKKFLRDFGIHGSTRAMVRKVGKTIVVEPRADFWSLPGSLKSKAVLSDKELKEARKAFSEKWPRKA